MKFEPLQLADVPSILAIEQDANRYPWTQAAFETSFGYGYFSYKLLNTAGDIVGFYIAQLIADQLELFNICVLKEKQGEGLGKLLLEHFLSSGQEKGALEALLEVRSTNINAISLYKRYGFKVIGLRKGYYVNEVGAEDAVLMQLVFN